MQKEFFKLMNVAPYGKTIENVMKRTIIKILTDMEKARRHAVKPQCLKFRMFNPNQIGVKSRKIIQVINKSFQLGYAVRKYSKLHMYKTYALLKDRFQYDMRTFITDIDSLIMQIYTSDLYRQLLDEP